jgi:hypothetical protein
LKDDFLCVAERHHLIEEIGYPARIWALTARPDFRAQGAPPMNCSRFVFCWDGKPNRSGAVLRVLPPPGESKGNEKS